MTPEQARLELDATTLRPQDASDEARALVEKDARLGAWVAGRTEFDEKVAAAFDDLPVPGNLHAKLLQLSAGPVPTMPKKRLVIPRLIIGLATAALLLFMGFHAWMGSARARGWQAEALAKVQLVEHGMSPLQHRSRDIEELKKTLLAEGSLSPASLPATLTKLRTYGCRTVEVAGKPATIVCFELAPGKEAHLVVMNASDLASAPPQKSPVFSKDGGWTMASWSDGTQSFMLATSAGEEMLKKLFV